MAKISVTFHVIEESGMSMNVSENARVSEVLQKILTVMEEPNTSVEAIFDNYLILFARPIALEHSDVSFSELGFSNGDFLHIVRTPMIVNSTLVLVSRDKQHEFPVSKSPSILGVGRDANKPVDIDLIEMRSEDELRLISRQQAVFQEKDGVWSVSLHPEASRPMFINNQKVGVRQAIVLKGNEVLSFGHDVDRPELQLVAQLRTN